MRNFLSGTVALERNWDSFTRRRRPHRPAAAGRWEYPASVRVPIRRVHLARGRLALSPGMRFGGGAGDVHADGLSSLRPAGLDFLLGAVHRQASSRTAARVTHKAAACPRTTDAPSLLCFPGDLSRR